MEGLLNRDLKDDNEAAVERGEPSSVCAKKAWHDWRPVNRGIWRGGEGLAFEWRMPEFDSYFRKLAVFAYSG